MLRAQIKLEYPAPRHVTKAVDAFRSGGLVVFPTDTTYGLGCDLYSKRSIDRIYQVKGLERSHPLSFLCADLSDVARYAMVENRNYRILRHHLPGRYTFILPASREVPKVVQTKRKTVGVRIPNSAACSLLLKELGHPILTTTASKNGVERATYAGDPDDIVKDFSRTVDFFLDAGPLFDGASTVIDLTGEDPKIVRAGSGCTAWLES
ncbi:MAG: L-threonylcarbamoyladenylate synthase [Myxococcota bacterium]|nr:L-threonylcarbamoyladenylate synthase [Myxococcota bacterium]